MPSQNDLDAYEANRAELERAFAGKFVVFHLGERSDGVFEDFDSANTAALQRYGDSPCLIRRVAKPGDRPYAISVIRSF